MAVNSLFVLMCRYTHCVKVYLLGGVWVNHHPQFTLDAPLGGGFPSEYCCDVWYGKIRMVWLPDGEKNLKICLFVLTECMYKRDRHTGRQTDGHGMTAKAALA